MAVREAAVADFIQGQLAAEKKKQLHAYISYYDMFKDAHKVKVPVEGSGEEFMRLAAEQILMVSGAPRRDHRDLTAFMKALNKTSFGQQTAKICRLEHLDGQGNDITEKNKLPPFIDSCFQDAFKDPLSIREDLKVLIGLGQYLDPASRNINGELVGFNGGGLTRTYTKEELENIGIWGVQSIQGKRLPNNECEATIIINYNGMNIAASVNNLESIKCKFTSNFKPITPDTKDYFLGNATKNRWFNANADRRTGANPQIKRELYRTGIKFLICKEIGDTFQVLFHSLYASSAEPSSPSSPSSPQQSRNKDMSICMLTCDNVVSSRSRLEGNTVLARSGNAENDEEDEEKDKFGEYTLYYKGDPEVEKRGLISMFCNNSIRNNEKVITIIQKILDEGSLEIQGNSIDLTSPKNKYIPLFLDYILNVITKQNTEISAIKTLVNPNQSPEEVRKLCIKKEAVMMFKQQRDKITCIYTLEKMLPDSVSYAELLEGFFTYLAGQPKYSIVRYELQKRATTAGIAASKIKKPQLGSILLSLLSNVPLLTTRERPTRSRVIESVSLLPLNISITNDPNLSIPGSAIATINSPKVNNLTQQGGLYRFEEENLRVSNHDPSFTMRDTPNEMYRYTVDCLFLEINNEIHMSKIQIQSFSPDILFHFFNLMYYYFNYVGEICAEKGILKRCIYTFLTGGFSNLKLEDFESWYLNQKETFLNDGLIDDVPDLTYFLISSDRAGRSLNEDNLKEKLSVSPQRQRTNSFTGEFPRPDSAAPTSPIVRQGSSGSKRQRPQPPGGSNSNVETRVGTPRPTSQSETPIKQLPKIPEYNNQKSGKLNTSSNNNQKSGNSEGKLYTKPSTTSPILPVFGEPRLETLNPLAQRGIFQGQIFTQTPSSFGNKSSAFTKLSRGGRQTRKRKYRKTRKTRKNYD
jgi:hypothetical protein